MGNEIFCSLPEKITDIMILSSTAWTVSAICLHILKKEKEKRQWNSKLFNEMQNEE